MFRTFACAALLMLSTIPASLADSAYYPGGASLSLSRNIGETGCWVEQDCPEGEVCHAAINVDGEAAGQLAALLKARVDKDPTFAEWGLNIYVSRNDGLYCDLTEPDNPSCTINFNPQTAELEGPISCE